MDIIRRLGLLGLLVAISQVVIAKNNTKTVVVYSVTSFSKQASKAFRKATGIKVHVLERSGSGATLARITGERLNPKADVWIGGSLGAHAQAAFNGLTEPYRPNNFDELDPGFRDPLGNNRVTGLYTGVLGFIVNYDVLKEKQLPTPDSWQSLLESQYHGLIGMKSPLVSGTAYTTLATLVQMMGEDAAFSYLKKLYHNLSGYTHSHTRLTSQGKLGITITFLHEAIEEKHKFPEKNIDTIIPKEGTGYEIGGLSLIKSGPNPIAAKHFINFILSEKGQILFNQTNYQFPVNVKVQKFSKAPKIDKRKLINFNFAWSGKNRQRLIDLYKQEVLANPNKAKLNY
ncbi:ABC transporter substrate-binding protein [Spartinivicinus poritis]|uniref:ABC transporter substrate-binding protein n=1 Tax=Spartinivicinus poritis TaxID=2994640 RepID=A0ABT5U6V7_9GAMM|nr:ABC transporter substrate-binding protein [Spartinivicinus sp. A2-2]MDE1462047.1 ABC transporter substrate-binding protein [Spartinivicinus sp. A2-2]